MSVPASTGDGNTLETLRSGVSTSILSRVERDDVSRLRVVLPTSSQSDLSQKTTESRKEKKIQLYSSHDHVLFRSRDPTQNRHLVECSETHGVISSPHPAERPLAYGSSPSFQIDHPFSPPDHLPIDLDMRRVPVRVPLGLGDMSGVNLGPRGRLRLILSLTAKVLRSTRSVAVAQCVGVPADSLGRTGQGEEDGGKGGKGGEEHVDG